MVSDWKANPYDEEKRYRLDHELWGKIFPFIVDLNAPEIERKNNLSLLGDEFSKLLNKRDMENFTKKMGELQKICPSYISELLAELAKHDFALGEYPGELLSAALSIIKINPDHWLIPHFLHCDHRLATEIIFVLPDEFIKLNPGMQTRVLDNFLITAKTSYEAKERLNGIINSADNVINKFVLQRFEADKIAKENAQREDALVKKGFQEAKKQLRFDTQGRMIVVGDVVCSLDVKKTIFENLFVGWVAGEGSLNERSALAKAARALFDLPSRSSIIPLQEEMEMHMRLVSRVIAKHAVGFNILVENSGGWKFICDRAAIEINKKVKEKFQAALLKAYDGNNNPKITISILNKELSAARKELALFAKQVLLQTLLGVGVEKNDLETSIDNIDEHAFQQTTATNLKYIRTDLDLQSCVELSETDITAHHKKKQDDHYYSATRIVHRNHYDGKNVMPSLRAGLAIRVPSIAVVNELEHAEAVRDVAHQLRDNYKLIQDQLGGYDGPMTYNLLTSLHSKLWDITADRKNRQRKSAARIFKGAHLFNRDQVLDKKSNSLWYVQNIAVNQHTNNLDYNSFDDATAEATVMAEIAMLSNFAANAACLPPAMRAQIENEYTEVHAEYVNFLRSNVQGDLYFRHSDEGKQVVERLKLFKQYLSVNKKALVVDNVPVTELAMKTLMKIMSMDKHWEKSYGALVQSLSIYIEYASQGGCKSANERYHMIAGTVDVLDSSEKVDPSKEEDVRVKVVNAMRSFLNEDDDKHNLKEVRASLNNALNELNLHGADVGKEDQGSANKQEASHPTLFTPKSGEVSRGEMNTNVGLPPDFTNVYAEGASAMQAHKGDHVADLKVALENAVEVVNNHRLDI